MDDLNATTTTSSGLLLSLHVDLTAPKEKQEEHANQVQVPQTLCDTFRTDGFVVIDKVLNESDVQTLNDRLEHVLRGRYDRSTCPDKFPRILKSDYHSSNVSNTDNNNGSNFNHKDDDNHQEEEPNNNNNNNNNKKNDTKKNKKKTTSPNVGPLGFSGNTTNVKVLQIINIHKADIWFRRLATSPQLGKVVAQLAGWEHGARLAQDQVWAKPPGAPPLTFHRDSPYFMFTPSDVVTVWVALDDMHDKEIGPLEYVRGSHKWANGRIGSANQFFQPNGGLALLQSAAEKEGIAHGDLEIVSMAGLLHAGGISIHDGKTWHGSPKNSSRTKPRRGFGIHFVPKQVTFTKEAIHSRLWRRYVENTKEEEDVSKVVLPEEDFPITWTPAS